MSSAIPLRFTSRRRLGRLIGCLGAVAYGTVTTTAHAYPTSAPFFGPTGLGTIPTAQTVPARQAEVGVGYEHVDPDFGSTRFLPVVTATYGIGRGEVGAGYLRERVSGGGLSVSTNFFTLHGKYRFFEKGGSALAVGAQYLDYGSNFGLSNGSLTALYLAGSQEFARSNGRARARGHLGLLYQHTSSGDVAVPGVDTSKSVLRPMAGLEYFATPMLTLAADFVPEQSDAARQLSLALRYQAPSGFGAQLGIGKLSNDTKIFASIVYRFGGKHKRHHHAPVSVSTTNGSTAQGGH